MLASKFLELWSDHPKSLLLHDIGPDLGHILPDQPQLVLKVPSNTLISSSKQRKKEHRSLIFKTSIRAAHTSVAATLCKPVIPGRLLMLRGGDSGSEDNEFEMPWRGELERGPEGELERWRRASGRGGLMRHKAGGNGRRGRAGCTDVAVATVPVHIVEVV
jgi:hypothetical protein